MRCSLQFASRATFRILRSGFMPCSSALARMPVVVAADEGVKCTHGHFRVLRPRPKNVALPEHSMRRVDGAAILSVSFALARKSCRVQ